MLSMAMETATDVLDERDRRLVAALQCDGRLPVERAATVLGISPRTVRRRWSALFADGIVKVVLAPQPPDGTRVVLLRVRVLRGRLDAVTAALAARDDIPFIDVSAGGDEISAIALTGSGPRDQLVFEQLPATSAVTSVTAQTVLHVFRDAADWRLDVLTARERAALAPRGRPASAEPLDATDGLLLAALADDARASAASLAAHTGVPDSTVRRRLTALAARGALRTLAVVDHRRLGLAVDANVWLQVPPDRLEEVGRHLAQHPAVHGALATTGQANLHAAVWLPDLAALYRFVTEDLAGLGIQSVDTVLVGTAVKRPGHLAYRSASRPSSSRARPNSNRLSMLGPAISSASSRTLG
jgi:DNA-binding Lrp family transcriptional regulator